MREESLDTVTLGASLGSGVTGEVFEVLGREADRVVKRFNSLSIDRSFQQRNFARWAAMPGLHGAPRVLDQRFDRPPYSVLKERIHGRSLAEHGPFKEAAAWRIVRRLAEILGHAHKHGVYHGHLHPGGVILGGDEKTPDPIVPDFGSGLVGEVHHIELGETAFFAAPEQLLSRGNPWGEGRIQRWDVYSFGVLSFWLINGRVPRALSFLKEHRQRCEHGGGRPVPLDLQDFVDAVHREPAVSWGSSFGLSREHRLYREIIDRCLALDPSDRPVDLREVRNLFRSLEHRFALEEAEARVVRERNRQRAKLFGARTVAACLGLSFLGATYYLVDLFRKTYFFRNKVSELDQVVVTQQATIHHLDERWTDAVTDLKESREAADAFFHRIASGDDAGESGVASIPREDLEKSRDYYLATLADLEENEATGRGDPGLERARALHSLAHIERRMGIPLGAAGHFREAIAALEAVALRKAASSDDGRDLLLRLADSYENLTNLTANPYSPETVHALESAVSHFETLLRLDPADATVAARLAGTCFKLGRALDANRRHDSAIEAYSRAAELADEIRAGKVESGEEARDFTELVGSLQFQTAKALREAARPDESIDAHIAAMETLETLRGVHGFNPAQAVRLAEGYLELGELFSGKGATVEDLDPLFNEALRLVTPVHGTDPGDVEAAGLLCRSLTHLAVLERGEGKWSSAYRMSMRGIEALAGALAGRNEHVPGLLQLAEARIEHLGFLEDDPEVRAKVLELGIGTAETAARLLEGEEVVAEPLRGLHLERLSRIFARYEEKCTEFGAADLSRRCRGRVVAGLAPVPGKGL